MERNKKLLAVIMSVFMVLTMIPSMVFAAPSGEMAGKLKVFGYAVVGTTLKADFSKASPEGITEDDVSFVWSRKISENELEKVGTEKTYKVTDGDLGYKLVLEVTGKEDIGLTGTLKATTPEVTATEEEAKNLVDAEISETGEAAITPPVEESAGNEELTANISEDEPWEDISEEGSWEEIPESNDQGSAEREFEGELSDEGNGDDDSVDDTQIEISISEELNGDNAAEAEDITYQAEAVTGNETGIVDLGTVSEGREEDAAAYVTIKNTGTGVLNFEPIAPEHFMVMDIEAPLQPEEDIQVWVQPREGLETGDYLDTITYLTNEDVEVSFQVQMTLAASEEAPAEAPEEAIPVYGLTADMDAVTFENLTAGYEETAGGWTVTLTNSGEEKITLKIPESEAFEIIQNVPEGTEGSQVLEKDAQASFTIKPKLGLAEGTYKEALVFGIEESTEITRTVNADVTVVAPEEKISVALNPESIEFDSLEEGYEMAEPITITVTNTGNVGFSLAQPMAEYFDIEMISETELSPGESITFTVAPTAGLTAGEYQNNIQIFSTDNTETLLAELPAVVRVSEKEIYKLEVSPNTLDFGEGEAGAEAPVKQIVTLINKGNTQIVLEKPVSEYFKIGNLSKDVLEPGEECTFAVRPKDGLEEGIYSEMILIPNNADADVSVEANYTVTMQAIDLLKIQKPSSVKNVKNGAEKSVKGLGLPASVVIETTEGNMKAKVKWNVEECAYDRSGKEAQSFTVKGKVSLPEGVSNSKGISLSTSIKVSVNAAYVPKIADPSDNKIKGIASEGYTTQSKISFEAVGAGMDNTSPRSGDVRYEPVKWKVINTNSWQGAPYSATFGITKAGNYTLKVLFERQQYNGKEWEAEGENDTKQVAFSIAQGTVVTPTPTAQQKNTDQKSAVRTGDTTAILPFVIILIVAVLCIAGVVVYKKKKK